MLFVDAFLQNNRLDHVTQVMGYHPTYLDVFLRTQNFILRGDGPLPYDYRHFIAIMVRTVWQKSFVVEWSGKAWLREKTCDTDSGVYWSRFISIRPYLYLTIQNWWGTVTWYQIQPGGMLQCIHATRETLRNINTTTRHCKVSAPPQVTAKYQHYHKTLHIINTTTRHCKVSAPPQDTRKCQHHHKTLQSVSTTTRHCKVSAPPQDTAKYQYHHKTLQSINTICETLPSMHATSETLQCIKTVYGTLHSIPTTGMLTRAHM